MEMRVYFLGLMIFNKILFFVKPKTVEQLWRYTIVGSVVSLLDFVLYVLITRLFGVNYLIANFISMSIAVTLAFYLNKNFTFNNKERRVIRQYIIFWINTFLMLALSELTLFFFVNYIYFNDILVKMGTYALVYLLNFSIQRLLIFGNNSKIHENQQV